MAKFVLQVDLHIPVIIAYCDDQCHDKQRLFETEQSNGNAENTSWFKRSF